MKTQANRFKDKVRDYIIKRLFVVQKQYSKSRIICYVLVLLKCLFQLMENINSETFKKLMMKQGNTKELFEILEKLFQEEISFSLLLLFISINSIIILFLFIDFTFFIWKNPNIQSLGRVYRVYSFILQVYEYTLFIPSIRWSILGNITALKIINLALTLIIITMIEMNNYDFRYEQVDFLAKKPYLFSFLSFILEIVSHIILRSTKQQKISCFFNVSYHLLQIIYYAIYHPILKTEAQQLINILHCTNITFAINLGIADPQNQNFDYFFCFLVTLPAGIVIGLQVTKFTKNEIFNFCFELKNLQQLNVQTENIRIKNLSYLQNRYNQLDIFLRNLNKKTKYFYDEYTTSYNSIFLEQVINCHKESCQDLESCFCSKGCSMDKGGEQFLGGDIRKKFISEFTMKMYQQHIQESRRDPDFTHFSYLSYLIDKTKNERLAYSELIQLKRSKNMSQTIMFQQSLHYLFYYAERQFKKKVNQVQLQRQKRLLKMSLFDIIRFEEDYLEALALMKDCLKYKQNVIQILGKDYVDLNELYEAASHLFQQKNQVLIQLQQLLIQNPSNQQLLNQCFIYEETFDFNDNLKQITRKLNKLNGINKLPFDNRDSCVVFVSLLNNFGNIVKVSNNFQEIFPSYTNQNAINSNINILLPNQIQEQHQQLLRSFISQNDHQLHVQNLPIQLSSSKGGWAIPYDIKLQYHQMGDIDLGVCALIRRIENNSLYLSLQIDKLERKCTPIVMSERLFEEVFKDIYNPKQISSINLNVFIPALYGIIEDQENVIEKETIIIQPHSRSQLIDGSLDYILNQSYFNGIFQDNQIFLIKFQIQRCKSKLINLTQLEITSLKKVDDNKFKYEILQILRSQLVNYCHLDANKSIESLQDIKNANSNQNVSEQSQESQKNLPQQIKQKSILIDDQNQLSNSKTIQINQISNINELPSFNNEELNNQKEEVSFDQNNLTSRYLLNYNSTLNDLDNLQLIQGISTNYEQLKTKTSSILQPISGYSQTHSILKKKFNNSDKTIEKLIDETQNSKQLVKKQVSEWNNKKFQTNLIEESFLSNCQTNNNQQFIQNKRNQKKKEEQEIKNEQSVSTNQTSNSKKKKEVINQIQSSKRILGLIIINNLGIVALLTIFLINLLNFIDLQEFLHTQKYSFHFLNWNSNVRISLSSVFSNFYLSSLIGLKFFQYSDPTKIKYLEKLFLDQMQEQRINYSNLVSQYSIGNKDKIQTFNEIMENTFDYINLIGKNSFITTSSVGYSLIVQKGYLDSFRTIPKYFELNSLTTIFQNFDKLDEKLKFVQEDVFKQYSESIHSVLKLQEYNLLSISLITLLSAFSILPINLFIQIKREQILKLMTNISPDKLKTMLQTTKNYQIQVDQELLFRCKEKINKKNNIISSKAQKVSFYQDHQMLNLTIEKKKNMSSTSSLPKVNLKYLIGALIFFILLQIYSFSIFIILQIFSDNTIDNRKFMNQLSETRHYLYLQTGTDYIAFVAKLRPQILPVNADLIIQKVKQLDIIGQTYLNNIYEYQDNFQGRKRYKQQKYDRYVVEILERNSCDVIKENPEYLNQDIKFDYLQCKNVGKQLFDKGLVSALKSIFVFNKQIRDLFDISSPQLFYLQLTSLDKYNSLIDFMFTIEQTSIIIEQLNYFLEEMTNQLFDYLIFANISLLIAQLSATILVLFLGWYKFYEIIEKSLKKTKLLLEVIDIDILLENSYVLSFFKSDK